MEIYIDHIVVVVKDEEKAKKIYRDILDLEPTRETEGLRGTPGAFRSIHYKLGDVTFELMTPPGPDAILLNRSIEKRGEGVHHIGFGVSDMDTVIKRCQAAGIRLVDEVGEIAKLGGKTAYTDPRVTHRTLHQFMAK